MPFFLFSSKVSSSLPSMSPTNATVPRDANNFAAMPLVNVPNAVGTKYSTALATQVATDPAPNVDITPLMA